MVRWVPNLDTHAYGRALTEMIKRKGGTFTIEYLQRIPLVSVLIGIVASYGILIRVNEYIRNRSLFGDEVALVANIFYKSITQLIIYPLDYAQAAPLGFLLLVKPLVMIFGALDEHVLRFIPLCCGVFSVILYFLLLKRCTNKGSTLIAMVLFSFSWQLLRYQTEFKPYSSDVMVALLILLFGIHLIPTRFNRSNAIQLGALGASVIWFSFPSVFVLSGVGIAILFRSIINKHWGELKHLCVCFIIWGISFVVLYFFYLKDIKNSSFLEKFWMQYCMPLPSYSLHGLLMILKVFGKMLHYPGEIYPVSLGAIVFVLGAYAIYKKNKILSVMFLTPIIFTAIASSLHYYPFSGRFLLFYLPVMYLIISEGIIFLIKRDHFLFKLFGSLVLIAILYHPVTTAPRHLTSKLFSSIETRPIVKYVANHIKEGDSVYLYYQATASYRYYAKMYGIDKFAYIEGVGSQKNWEKYKEDLSQLKGKGQVWVIFAGQKYKIREMDTEYIIECLFLKPQQIKKSQTEEEYMVSYLDSIGIRKYFVKNTRASVYLYDFN